MRRWGGPGRCISALIWRINVLISGCYLSPRADIGPGLALPHPTGVIIGDGVELGPNATIYQHVTLGTKRFGTNNYPRLGQYVTCYPGSVIVGSVTLGDGVVVGANAFVDITVPANQMCVGIPARVISHSAQDRTRNLAICKER